MIEPEKEVTLIHGIIRSTFISSARPVAVIFHAWIEYGECMHDLTTMTAISSDVFMRFYDAEIIYRYSFDQVRKWVLDTGHYGPWEKLPNIQEITLEKKNGKAVGKRT